jgi:hypothetical protein
MADVRRVSLAIANGQTVSAAFNASDCAAFGLQMPAAFTGTTVSFQVSADDGTTYQALYDTTNTLVSMTVAASRSYDLPAELAAWDHFKIVSGLAEGAARTLIVVGKRS